MDGTGREKLRRLYKLALSRFEAPASERQVAYAGGSQAGAW